MLKGAWEKLSGMANVIDDEMKIICKINRFMKEYGLELLFDIEDIDEGIKELPMLIEKYESVHVALKRELANKYAETYKDYDKNISMMIEWLQNAKMEIRKRKADKAGRENEEKDERIRKENEEKDGRIRKENEKDERIRKENEEKDEGIRKENEEKDERIRKENEEKDGRIGKQKDRLKAEEKHFREKIGREIKNMNDKGSSFLEDIERNMSEVKELMRGYPDIFLRIEEFGEVYKDISGNQYDEQNDKMDTFIREMMKKVQNIKLDDIKALEKHAKAIENDKYECAKKEKLMSAIIWVIILARGCQI